MPLDNGGPAMHDDCRIILASSSPRRRALLEQINARFRALDVPVSEEIHPGESPPEYVIRLALAKARAGREKSAPATLPVLGADTAVVVGDDVLGKPCDREHGLAMLARLSGITHTVMTAVALVGYRRSTAPDPVAEVARLSVSRVTFRSMTAQEQAAYWDSGEPMGKAGGYAIQGLAAKYITHIDGSYSGIVGLPLFETAELFAEFGVTLS